MTGLPVVSIMHQMRIGLLSDTHIPLDAEDIPPQVKKVFSGVDLILHAGDVYRVYVLDELRTIAPVFAALGDDDPITLAVAQRAQKRHDLKIGGFTLLLTHYRPSHNLIGSSYQEETSAEDIYGGANIVVFGHEHNDVLIEENGVLLVNPGSPTFLHYQRGLGTVGILEISAGKAEVHIVQLGQ